MSEVLDAEIEGTEENGFSRRRVVAGVAWSLPVIATAIAAPAAAASPGPISATATWSYGAAPQYSKIGGGGKIYGGAAPATLSLKNTGTSAFTGTVSVTVTMTPKGTVLVGIGAESLAPAASSGSITYSQHQSTKSFSYSLTNFGAGQTQVFSITYNYESVNPKPTGVSYYFVMGTSVVLTANIGGSLTLTPAVSPDPHIQF
ncbi:hypothetical protein [Pseudarthrobacter sp. NIBRBAC000502770]|uniref:hypothetical protein n=1 Tax=Pseudarthrobacter sp. NIBRBAC000502770 TaxID=2590785 RepID=UPI0011408BEC|nr:hypothetical protein [Pseudarthrobacter sp. NIBRBAC000502770]QDG89427.1 hypothetical protein NIBR502770_13755 [Pseudarthrobacter sp. NIBRBAC000502770]